MSHLPAFINPNDGSICCPICGREDHYDNLNVHLGPVSVRQNGTETTVDREGDKVRTVTPNGRGSTVSLALWCESGHRFSIQFSFHKGSTYLTIEPGESFDLANEKPPELWRD